MGTELDRDTSQRIDRWLWHARFFKSRGLATEAVKLGRIAINGIRAKPAKPVRAGDTVLVTKSTLRYEVIVQDIVPRRVCASIAQQLYRETGTSAAHREGMRRRQALHAIVETRSWDELTKKERRQREHLKRSY